MKQAKSSSCHFFRVIFFYKGCSLISKFQCQLNGLVDTVQKSPLIRGASVIIPFGSCIFSLSPMADNFFVFLSILLKGLSG